MEEKIDEILERLERIEQRLTHQPTYSVKQLRSLLGYGQKEAYQVIRTHGKMRRVTADNLVRYAKGLPASWD